MTERATGPASRASIPALTGVRFLAALAVAICHFDQLGLIRMPAGWFDFIDGSRPAVSLFFVLSGFVLSYTYREPLGVVDVRRFYLARFARIYPTVVLSLVLASVTVWILLRSEDQARLVGWFALKDQVPLLLIVSLACQLLLLTGWLPFATLNQPWNAPAWSVSCEAFFYALFPWMTRVLHGVRMRSLVLMCVILWLAEGALIAVFELSMPANRKGFLMTQWPLVHLFEFVAGFVAARAFLMRRRRSGNQARALVLIGVSTVALLILCAWQPIGPPFYLQSPFYVMLIGGLALLERPVTGLLAHPGMQLLGEASFALYLIHVPFGYLLNLAGVGADWGPLGLLAVIGLSVVVHRRYEEPMRRGIRGSAVIAARI